MKCQNSKFRVWIAPYCFSYYFREISMENWQTKRHLEIFGSIFTKLQIHFIIKAVGYCRYASFCVIIDGPHCIFCPDFTYYLEFSRIYKGGWTERAFILCKLNKSQLESSKSVVIHRQKSFYSLKNLYTLESGIDVGQGITVGPGKFVKKNKHRALEYLTNQLVLKNVKKWFVYYVIFR